MSWAPNRRTSFLISTRSCDYFEGHLDQPETWRYLVVQG